MSIVSTVVRQDSYNWRKVTNTSRVSTCHQATFQSFLWQVHPFRVLCSASSGCVSPSVSRSRSQLLSCGNRSQALATTDQVWTQAWTEYCIQLFLPHKMLSYKVRCSLASKGQLVLILFQDILLLLCTFQHLNAALPQNESKCAMLDIEVSLILFAKNSVHCQSSYHQLECSSQ